MAHFLRVVRTVRLKNELGVFKKEKEKKVVHGEEDSDDDSLKGDIVSVFRRRSRDGFLGKYHVKVKTPNTIENIVLKSFLGFISGVILTYIFFFFFYLGVSVSLKNVTYTCMLAGVFLCLGLAFSAKVRCYVLLLLPVLFSKQGRQALLAYALFLAFTGPARNTMHNMAILSDSMTCGQEMVRGTLQEIFEMVKTPCKFVKETLERTKEALIDTIEIIETFVMKIRKIIVCILEVFKKSGVWLRSVTNLCNKNLGTPFQRCMVTFDAAITDCKAKLGVMDFMCHIVHVVKGLCYSVKWLDFICTFTEFASDVIAEVVKIKLMEFGLQMKNLFYVSIEFNHSYEFEMKASNSTKQVGKTILQKVSGKLEKVQTIFSFFGFVFTFLFFLVFFRVYYYKYKYLTSDTFDNLYISKYITELDCKRAQMGRETVLPLEPREKKIYATPSSLRLLQEEKVRSTESMFLLGLTSFKIISFIVFDYSLFWILLTMYEAGQNPLPEAEKFSVVLHVEGSGVLADFYRKLGRTLRLPPNPNIQLNSLHCLPDPVTPDTGRYIQIGFLLMLCWFFTLTEAYGLRLRNIVMSHYYPDRARERAVWLYNHILHSRGSFLRFARRQLRKKYQVSFSQSIKNVTLKQALFSSFPFLSSLFGKNEEFSCILCRGKKSEVESLKRCKLPDCSGKYCKSCYATLENVCTICQHPIEYGDISDISEEMDSSDEDRYKPSSGDILKTNYDSDGSTEEKFKTFKELQVRESFKDVESNQKLDYVKISDLTSEEAYLRKKLKEALTKRINKLKAVKSKSNERRRIEYARLKRNLQMVVRKLKRKKLEKSEEKNFHKSPIVKSDLESSRGKRLLKLKSRLENKLPSPSKMTLKYEDLKRELKERLKLLKPGKINSYVALLRKSKSEAKEGEEKVGEKGGKLKFFGNPLKSSITFYCIESERKIGSCEFGKWSQKPEIEEIYIWEKATSLEDLADR